ncbi:hypothetical protein AK812_SmicGene6356 [Symbiodinium microadriaticum]|uniref:Uncharacterized protein n=1 Tax=Symbiodinium microadriaticum TaxID=2951 RepID=A0A1Q9ERJ7_SYMMI|nr:hypothetical protein AK812_SmicGene6356 [Symbiodinium microadriaticum]
MKEGGKAVSSSPSTASSNARIPTSDCEQSVMASRLWIQQALYISQTKESGWLRWQAWYPRRRDRADPSFAIVAAGPDIEVDVVSVRAVDRVLWQDLRKSVQPEVLRLQSLLEFDDAQEQGRSYYKFEKPGSTPACAKQGPLRQVSKQTVRSTTASQQEQRERGSQPSLGL